MDKPGHVKAPGDSWVDGQPGAMQEQPNNPTHGVKLQDMVSKLVEIYGWEGLADRINVRCFQVDPSLKSSLKFLRKTPWARTKVESLYLRYVRRRRAAPALPEEVSEEEILTEQMSSEDSPPEA
jgi:uncharacterized protein (DUF2132 family)